MANGLWLVHSFNPKIPLTVEEEARRIRDIGNTAGCELLINDNARQDELSKMLKVQGRKMLVFHFAGHAESGYVELNNSRAVGMSATSLEHFSKIIKQEAPDLRLVFLNGCSTEKQAQFLLDNQIPVVIYTMFPLEDGYAMRFAAKFYDNFLTHKYTLQKAFDTTILEFNANQDDKLLTDQGQINEVNFREEVVKVKRGNFMLDLVGDGLDIYQIKGSDAVLNQTFENWQTEKAPVLNTESNPDKIQPENKGTYFDEAYLLCDRSEQIDTFSRIVQLKQEGKLPEPNLVFINGVNEDCVPELLQRLDKYVLPEHCEKTGHRREEFRFPPENYFGIKDDDQKPILALEEAFQNQILKKLGQNYSHETLFLFCHKIYKPFYHNDLEKLLKHYLGPFSHEMKKFSQRIIVLFLIVHNNKPEQQSALKDFGELCLKLKGQAEYQNRVDYFDKLPLVEAGDLYEWHDQVFEGHSWDTITHEIPDDDLYYLSAKHLMEEVIQTFKNKKGHG